MDKIANFKRITFIYFHTASNNLQLVLLNGTREFAFYDGVQPKHYGCFPNDFNWHHLVWVLNGTSTSLYLDETLVNTITTASTTQSDIVIGSNAGISGVIGSIDQVRIFNRALRPYEVEALYTEEYCTPTIVPSEHFNTVTMTG